MLASQKAADNPHAERFVSPVGVVVLANRATQIGMSEVLYLLILINIFVGIFNLVPVATSGRRPRGHCLVRKGAQFGTRRPYHADVNKLAPVLYAVLAVLAFYAISSLFLDLRDLLG